MAIAKVDKRYRVVLPKKVRDALGLRPGDRLEVELVDGAIRMRPAESHTSRLYGRDAEVWRGVDAVEYIRNGRGA